LITEQGTVIQYHGTDWESALDILNHGLNVARLQQLQYGRSIQLGPGWYTTDDFNIAWYFASIAPGTIDQTYTVIEIELYLEHLESLVEQGLARKSKIINVPFQGEQYWFHFDALEFLNQHAVFRPYQGEI
jgi:hypothetical protein